MYGRTDGCISACNESILACIYTHVCEKKRVPKRGSNSNNNKSGGDVSYYYIVDPEAELAPVPPSSPLLHALLSDADGRRPTGTGIGMVIDEGTIIG